MSVNNILSSNPDHNHFKIEKKEQSNLISQYIEKATERRIKMKELSNTPLSTRKENIEKFQQEFEHYQSLLQSIEKSNLKKYPQTKFFEQYEPLYKTITIEPKNTLQESEKAFVSSDKSIDITHTKIQVKNSSDKNNNKAISKIIPNKYQLISRDSNKLETIKSIQENIDLVSFQGLLIDNKSQKFTREYKKDNINKELNKIKKMNLNTISVSPKATPQMIQKKLNHQIEIELQKKIRNDLLTKLKDSASALDESLIKHFIKYIQNPDVPQVIINIAIAFGKILNICEQYPNKSLKKWSQIKNYLKNNKKIFQQCKSMIHKISNNIVNFFKIEKHIENYISGKEMNPNTVSIIDISSSVILSFLKSINKFVSVI